MERETLALHGNNFRSHVTRLIKNMYVKLVDLLFFANIANDQNEWAPVMPRKHVRIAQPWGSVLFLGASGCLFFFTPGLVRI
jgi:hypothetical protein